MENSPDVMAARGVVDALGGEKHVEHHVRTFTPDDVFDLIPKKSNRKHFGPTPSLQVRERNGQTVVRVPENTGPITSPAAFLAASTIGNF